MKKTVRTVAAMGVVLLSSAFLNDSVHAVPQSNLQQNSANKTNLSEAEEKIANVMIELENLNEKIDKVNNALKVNKEKMKETNAEIDETEAEVASNEEEMEALREDIEVRFEILKNRIVSYQKSGGDISFLEVIFGSESFGDLIRRVSAVSKIAESDNKLMERLEDDENRLKKKQKSVETKLANLKKMKAELEGIQDTIVAQKKQNEEDEKVLQEKRQHLITLKSNLQDENKSLAVIESAVNRPANNTNDVQSNSDSSSPDLTTLAKKKTKAPSRDISIAINAGMPYLGTPYVWGGGSTSGFDCSGFISWAFAQAGISVPSSTAGLQYTGTRVSYSNIQPGDLIFFNTYKTNGHVGIYLGNGKFIGSQNSGLGIANMTSGYWNDKFAGHVRRVR